MKTSATNYEESAKAVAKVLGVEMNEMEDWNCCGVVATLASDDLMHQLAPVRILVKLQDAGQDSVVVLCDMCYNTLCQTEHFVKENEEGLKTINLFMDRESDYNLGVKVVHFLQYLRDVVGVASIQKKIKKKLAGLKCVPYYGCMLLRPKECAIDDQEEPTIIKDLMVAAGAEVVDNPYKIECCGSYNTVNEKELVAKRTYRIVNTARNAGGEMIVLSCPLCRFNLDNRSKQAKELHSDFEPLPVVYYTQLLALALGLDEDVLGFDKHYVDPRPLLREKGLLK